MSFEMNAPAPASSSMRFDPFDVNSSFPFKPLPFNGGRPHSLTLAEQAELEFELRYRGNMIVDQQRKIQQLEEELKRAHEQLEMMGSQLSSYEQERMKEKKKPQSRYWTPEEHQRFLEALAKYGHKDVKAISMHVSTRNATQVRTHAQKYFLRLERERRKKQEEGGSCNGGGNCMKDKDDGYDSLEDSGSPYPDNPSPQELDSTPSSPLTVPSSLSPLHLPVRIPIPRRRRSVSMITPTLMKFAHQHRDAVLALLSPSWTTDDFDQFVKGLVALVDKQEDVTQVCHAIREGFLSHHSLTDVETCYRHLHKFLRQKPITSSPKRRRSSSKPEPVSSPMGMDGPLPAMGTMGSSLGNPFSFLNNTTNLAANFQYPTITPSLTSTVGSTNSSNNNNSNNSANNTNNGGNPPQSSLSFSGLMRPPVEYGTVPSMNSVMDMDLTAPSPLSVNSLGGMSSWNSLAFSFDLQSVPPSLGLPPQASTLVSSHN